MSFLTVGGDGSTRPTFFELVASDRLGPSLKAAIVYSLAVCVASAFLKTTMRRQSFVR